MEQYYVYRNEQQEGPFSIDELKTKALTKETKVWYNGLQDWKNASEIEELKSILTAIPPPINSLNTKPLEPQFDNIPNAESQNSNNNVSKTFGLNKKVFGGIIAAVALILVFSLISNQVINSKDQQKTTEAYNNQLEKQQKEIEEQNNRLSEQERKEAERIEKERIEKLEKHEAQLNENVNNLYNNLSEAKRNLNEVTSFKLLRSVGERNQQINEAQNRIDLIKENIKTIEDSLIQVNKELGN